MNPKLKMGSSSLEKKLSLQKSTKTTEEIKKSVDEKMRRSISDKGLFPPDHSNRYLVIINVVGGTGPIKFLVNRDSNVKSVIEKALKIYNREGRHPAIGSDTNNLYLYPADVIGSDDRALKLEDPIGSCEARRFVLSKQQIEEQQHVMMMGTRKGGNKLRSWLQKSLSFGVGV